MYYCLRTEHVYNAFYERFGSGFVFVENEEFQRNGFDGHECSGCRYEDPLFLLVDHNRFHSPEYQRKKMASLRLERELFKFYEPAKFYSRIFFGSTRTRLASDSSDLDLAIVIPQFINASNETLKELKGMPTSFFNMHYLATKLREIGLVNVQAIQGATVPICKFTDSETGLQCDINASSSLGVENSQLIDAYRKLDARVGPFLYALKCFVKKRDINDNRRDTLSSYAYCLLGIYFLMNYNHDSPIVSNLQDFKCNCDAECSGYGCKFGATNYSVDGQQKEQGRQAATITQWDGYCLDNLGKIMLEFFKWASNIENLTRHMSICYSDMDIPNVPNKWFRKSMVIQDPFVLSKNVASSCSELELNRILAEFQRAANLLEETDMTFVEMCNSRSELGSNSRFSNTAVEVPLSVNKPRSKRNKNRFRHRMQ
ncbi:uncharacterized protein ATC70_002598 [Mucor velutinosus]|uniref:Poly(A) RNA polymerase mitochondrial-like central palm domain-containing protein n=1 Tax=Mucor velutinosus TaxID=708070 RepID=A0AAN7DDN4_9FUNG|nr:hypothetical protein ATC70_002598 [Mucor velutinosus]